MRKTCLSIFAAVLGAALCCSGTGCSGTSGAPDDAGSDGGGPTRDAGGDATTGDALDATTDHDAPDGGALPDGGGAVDAADASCVGTRYTVGSTPLDLYMMLDQSGSMQEVVDGGATKWTAVTGAIRGFLVAPSAAGLGVGLQYFGLPPGGGGDGGVCTPGAACATDADCGGSTCILGTCSCGVGGGADSCLSADYQRPSVEIAPLPGVEPAITASIAAHTPLTATPTSAALQGAVDHAREWATAHPDHTAVVVLATDGDPTECDTSIANIAAIAQSAAAGTPKILTFVIGIGASLGNLNAIAAAGGTSSAFLVDTNGNVSQQLIGALDKIRDAARTCAYALPTPDAGAIDYALLGVQYVPGASGVPVTLPRVSGAASCPATGDGWYYDVNTTPSQVLLCPSTCTTVQSDANAKVAFVVGCGAPVP